MNKILLTALLAPAAILSGAAHAQTAPAPTSVEPLIPAVGTVLDVSAEGRTTRVPDLATIRAGVVSQGPTPWSGPASPIGTSRPRPFSFSRNIAMARMCRP